MPSFIRELLKSSAMLIAGAGLLLLAQASNADLAGVITLLVGMAAGVLVSLVVARTLYAAATRAVKDNVDLDNARAAIGDLLEADDFESAVEAVQPLAKSVPGVVRWGSSYVALGMAMAFSGFMLTTVVLVGGLVVGVAELEKLDSQNRLLLAQNGLLTKQTELLTTQTGLLDEQTSIARQQRLAASGDLVLDALIEGINPDRFWLARHIPSLRSVRPSGVDHAPQAVWEALLADPVVGNEVEERAVRMLNMIDLIDWNLTHGLLTEDYLREAPDGRRPCVRLGRTGGLSVRDPGPARRQSSMEQRRGAGPKVEIEA